MKVTITEKHIHYGIKNNTITGPISLAVTEALSDIGIPDVKYVCVDPLMIEIFLSDKTYSWHYLPDELKNNINCENVKIPFEFELDLSE
jgi:hypothetical protein